MEDIIRDNLQKDEKVLWCGKSASNKVMDRTYSPLYWTVILLSYGITAVTMFMAYKRTGELKLPVVLFLLVVGSMLPLSALYDGIKVRELNYAVNDPEGLKKALNGRVRFSEK